MIYLLLSILFTTLLVLTFKVFERLGIPIFQGIVFNYLSASVCAFILLPNQMRVLDGSVFSSGWFLLSIGLGTLFIIVFNLTSITTVRYGVSTASVAMKLGLVFPVLLAFTVYGEAFNVTKLIGIALAFAAVVLCSLKEGEKNKGSAFAILPVIVFLGSGACDSVTQFANKRFLASEGMEEFSLFLFIAAGVVGSSVFVFQLLFRGSKINFRSIVGGVILGVINYFSFIFLLKSLAYLPWGSSVVFPVSNLGTVALATLAGIVFFKERISRINLLGLILAALSIVLIILADVL
jgi:drug/metabolite transporter (DMT)-like permease